MSPGDGWSDMLYAIMFVSPFYVSASPIVLSYDPVILVTIHEHAFWRYRPTEG